MSENEEKKVGPKDEDVPEGMEKRVRRVRRRRKKEAAPEDMQSLLDRGKGLLETMQERDDHDHGHVGVKEQVRRLRKDGDEGERPLDEVWGTKKRSTRWLWVSLLGIILPLVAAGVAFNLLQEKETGPTVDESEFDVELEVFEDNSVFEEGPMAWFHRDSVKYITRAKEILRLVNEAETREELLPLMRSSDHRAEHPVVAKRWSSPMVLDSVNDITWMSAVSQRPEEAVEQGLGYLAVSGRREDQSRFRAFFVKEGHEFLLDWDATTGWSEMPLAEMKSERPTEPKVLRCLLGKKAIFDREFQGKVHSGYVLVEPETGEYLLAYVPLESEEQRKMDQALRDVLDYGRFVMPLKQDQPVVVSVKAVGAQRFEITDFHYRSWVNPGGSAPDSSASR